MKIKELEKDKITGLKVEYLLEIVSPNESVDWNDIINIDEVISDGEIFNYYTGIEFDEDGSLCEKYKGRLKYQDVNQFVIKK